MRSVPCALLAMLVSPALVAQEGAEAAEGDAEKSAGLVIQLSISKDVYETGELVRAELMFVNTSSDWVDLPKAATLSESLRLIDADENESKPEDPERFAAAKTDAVGPGGFVGFTFDVGMLFPGIESPGHYELAFSRKGLPAASVEFDVLPLVDPDKDYSLVVETTFGRMVVELEQDQAPRAVHDVVQLARLGFYDGAPIPFVQPDFGALVTAPVEPRHKIEPMENVTALLLAGTVILEPRIEEGTAVSYPNLIFLLAPRPERQGQATAIGRVVEGKEVLDKIASTRTSGANGSPPWRPSTPQGVKRVSVVERDESTSD